MSNSRPGYKNYRESYKPPNIIKCYWTCVSCRGHWYAADNSIGFIICPICKLNTTIKPHIDMTSGKLSIPIFNGEEYSHYYNSMDTPQ